jgi:hypothetical protein
VSWVTHSVEVPREPQAARDEQGAAQAVMETSVDSGMQACHAGAGR